MSQPPRIPASELSQRLAQAVLVDVRKPEEVAESGTVPGAVRIPIDQLAQRLDELPSDRPLIAACNGGGRGARAATLLAEHGFNVLGSCGLRHYQGERVFP